MHKPESVLEKSNHKILEDVNIPSEYPIMSRRPYLAWIYWKIKNLSFSGVCVAHGTQEKIKESKQTDTLIFPGAQKSCYGSTNCSWKAPVDIWG